MTDKERYATIGTWVEVFRKEGVEVSHNTVSRRLVSGCIVGETARDRIGRVVRTGFYCESDVRALLFDMIQPLPQADDDGIIQKDGETYGTFESLSRILGLSASFIKNKLESASVQSLRGRTQGHQVRNFYPLSDAQRLCAYLLAELPQADENGIFVKEGETYGTLKSLSGLVGCSNFTMFLRLQKSDIKPIQGKNSSGLICDYYALSDIRRLCVDLIQQLPEADENGFIKVDGETYGTVGSLSKFFSITPRPIRLRIKESSLKAVQGKDKLRRVQDFYLLSEVQKLCADLIEELPKADEDGIFEKEGVAYGTVKSLSKFLDLVEPTLQSRINRSGLVSIDGKNVSGRIFKFYSVPEVRKLCADLIAKRKKE